MNVVRSIERSVEDKWMFRKNQDMLDMILSKVTIDSKFATSCSVAPSPEKCSIFADFLFLANSEKGNLCHISISISQRRATTE